jgi:hypothetical protein
VGAALLAWQEQTTTVGKFIAVCSLPDVMQKRIEYAMLPGGWRDRDFLHKFVGLL